MANTQTMLSTVVEEFRELDFIFQSGSDLDVVERGYARKLFQGISNQIEILECEALKGLGDLYLHKAKMNKHKAKNFQKACSLYMELLRYYTSTEEKQVVQHRIRYAEKCTKLFYDQNVINACATNTENTTLAVSMTLHEMNKASKLKGHGTMPLVQGYTNYLVKAIVKGNKRMEIESLKSLGDLYLEKGRVSNDEAAFSKSASLYRAALDRCEDSDGRETLKHRIKYAEKVKEQQCKKAKKCREMGRTRNKKVGNSSEEKQLEEVTDSTYEDQLQKGCRALQTGDLDTAEKHFAAALKVIHVKGQHLKEAEPLCKLGDIYLKRGEKSKDGGDFTKAAALSNAALVRSKTEDMESIKQTIQKITQSFVENVLCMEQTVPTDDIEKHKSALTEWRCYVEEEIKRIEQQIDPYILDDNDPKITEVEKKRVEAIKALFDTIVQQRRTFITDLVDECIEVMGPPPCNYAMIGLGSQATGLVTPFSDLEFAILIEEETEMSVKYFQSLTHYLHLKVINLGETILPAMAIKSLNDFDSDNKLDNWFYDSVTPRGFSFDGAMPLACKTPLGRGKTCLLIRTPCRLAKYLEDDVKLHLKKGYHLASVLGNVSLIAGEQGLVGKYTVAWSQQLKKNGSEIARLLANTMLMENTKTIEMQNPTAQMLNVKKEMYRFSSLAVSCWALLCDIQPTTIWETIQQMYKKGAISDKNAHHLMVLVSISAELRLRTYMNNRGQVENMSVLSSMSTNDDVEEKTKKIFHFSNVKQLMRYYYTATPLKYLVSQLSNSQPVKEPSTLFDNSLMLQADVYESLCDYNQSKTCIEQALERALSTHGRGAIHPHIAGLLNKLGNAWGNLGDIRKAVSYHQQSLQMKRSIYGEDVAHPDIAGSLSNLCQGWRELGDYRKAISYNEQSLEMRQTIYGEGIAHPDIAGSLSSLGLAWSHLGDHKKSVSYHELSLKMKRIIYGEDIAHPGTASSLNNLGNAWREIGDHRKAVSCHEQALEMWRSIYGGGIAHPHIASSLGNLGNTWSDLGDHRKAISYHEQEIQMMRSIYGEGIAHPNIASSLNNLGNRWGALGDYRKAVSYHGQALAMRRLIYGEVIEHPDIAGSLGNLGCDWSGLCNHRNAVSYHEQALQMMRSIYGEGIAHPHIASSLSNLGAAWSQLGDHRKAASYFEQALEMWRSVYDKNIEHPDIATSLSNLGTAFGNLRYYRKAVSYFEQSLEMSQSIFGEGIPHPDIANSLLNLYVAWVILGDHSKAASYYAKLTRMEQMIEESSRH
ncbi:PREDICTED: uncharacterized protein LOC109465029 [Branchiostoma belcheri]|uniref:Uncharacterized protein LOC109465029 n=1 Tax=Branchiostoma belcheri TaxID=7741 RepID=A0A6P4YKR3_BRABE|nr:PREDICTED: uncharacterized protein LOC109465029 [Branchiostoma belcheri]